MASSDEEGEIVPGCVDNYCLINDKNEPVSVSSLPLLWSIEEINCDLESNVYLDGTSDDGLQKVHKQIIAWRYELSYVQPEISVLSKDKKWITLQRPRKCFENTIRAALVTVYWLHFVKRNPEDSIISAWNYLRRAFFSYDLKPAENDILNHVSLIRRAAEKDRDLAQSKHLLTFIQKPWSNEVFHESVRTTKKSKFIVDSEEEADDFDGEKNNTDEGLSIGFLSYDTVCAICDNGGEILPCEGRCLRSFHATKDAGVDSCCESLGYTTPQVNAIPNFFCENCKYQQHQCFACGELGSSDLSSNAEVFPCVTANCGHYYHPKCVARLLSPDNDTDQTEMRKRVAAGETFVCPLHKCCLCGKGEDKNDHDLQFAMCRRCPKAYHRKCLPREIAFESVYDKNIQQRAWEGLLDHRILIYCMDHEIDMELGTPVRNHLVFPDVEGKRKCTYNTLLGKKKITTLSRKSLEDLTARKSSVRLPNQVMRPSSNIRGGGSTKINEKRCSGQDISFFTRLTKLDASRKFLKDENRSVSSRSFLTAENESSWRNDNTSSSLRLHTARSQQQKLTHGRTEKTILEKPMVKKFKTSPNFVDADMEKRILSLMKESTSAFNEAEFKKSHQVLATTACFSETVFDKNLTQGKVEGSVKAIQTALKKLDEGYSLEDARSICDHDILSQVFIWQKKLKVYLAPFLHGMRYTSFGRHFTKIDKLTEIVDRLHWYVQNGDMIVDFCCGSNDFSCLMKSKLEQMGKFCSFKNYDLFQAKNDFNFEKRDWMSVNVEELPDGSQLIMGLNPPFGVNGCLANRFITKALKFKPKLIILIVPKVTKRLDRRKDGYDLIWEDDNVLSGKSFYLPGSVDTHNKQLEDWNLKPPPLYLWSRPDWTARHMKIAQKHGHIKEQYAMHGKGNSVTNYLMEENHDCYQNYSGLHPPNDYLSIFDGVPEDNDILPEEGASTPDKLMETVSPDCKIDKAETLPPRNRDDGIPYEAEEMYIDMELSSP